MRTFSIKEAFEKGWGYTRDNFGFFAGVILLYAAVCVVSGILSYATGQNPLVFIGQQILLTWISLGMMNIALKVVKDQERVFKDVFPHIWSLVTWWVSLLLIAICFFLVWMFGVALGYLGLILLPDFFALVASVAVGVTIVLALFLAIYFYFVPLCILDKNAGPIKALSMSKGLTKGVMWKLLGFIILALLINALGLLALLVGLFVTVPVTLFAFAWIYQQLSEPQVSAVSIETQEER